VDYIHLKKLIKRINETHPDICLLKDEDNGESLQRLLYEEEKEFLAELSMEVRKVEEFYFAQINEAKRKKSLLEYQLSQLEKCQPISAPYRKRTDGTSFSPVFRLPFISASPLSKVLPSTRSNSRDESVEEISDSGGTQSFTWTCSKQRLPEKDSQQDGTKQPKFQWRTNVSQYLLQNTPLIAKNQVKKAFVEVYRSLELLKAFRELNVTAYTKIVKKFEKYTNRNMKDTLMHELHVSNFFLSRDLEVLMTEIEDIFRCHFAEGNRARAMKTLRTINATAVSSTALGYPIFISGLCSGINIMLLVQIFLYFNSLSRPFPSNKVTLALIYFGLGFPIFSANLLAINMHVWDAFKVNYRLIFGVKPRTSTTAYFAFVSFLAMVYLVLVSISLFGDYNEGIPAIGQAWITIGVILVLFFNNLDFYDRRARKWLANVLYRILVSPTYVCRFKDFFWLISWSVSLLSFKVLVS
jgi:hypothetical protein